MRSNYFIPPKEEILCLVFDGGFRIALEESPIAIGNNHFGPAFKERIR